MREQKTNYAFIDSQNLHLGIRALGWKLDFARFRRYLSDKYSITKAFLFIGYLPGNEPMYENLRRQGFELVFKNTSSYHGVTKGNVDSEMILQTLIKIPLYDQAIIVTGDGDFYCLIEYLIANSKLEKLIIPNINQCSHLFNTLHNETGPYELFEHIEYQRTKLEYK